LSGERLAYGVDVAERRDDLPCLAYEFHVLGGGVDRRQQIVLRRPC
jgi:CobQ-like glutamine amidotransferase family enzyme